MRIVEALEQRRFSKGTVAFSKSGFNDPHVMDVIKFISTHQNVPEQQIIDTIQQSLLKLTIDSVKAPLLYETIVQNGVENELFTLFMKLDLPSPGPTFSERVFMKLQRTIASEHDEFWPLRSYIEKRPLQPKWQFVTLPMSDEQGITTAAATPGGSFIFNTVFMQKLMDYSFLKKVHPKGRKYTSNGGDIPDEYAYIEFLIMHELMHYSNDDFYYQKVIPNADPEIINWVGDFRSNYLLVKSGYEQLPIGLFNDGINYDRQKSYIDMYKLVEEEFNRLSGPLKQQIIKKMSEMSDNHKPGQAEGAASDAKPGDITPGQIDDKAERTKSQMEKAKDQTATEAKNSEPKPATGGGAAQRGRDGSASEVDWSKVRPSFDWRTLVKRFLSTAKPRMEDTYSKPARRSVSQMDIARQLGSAAVKPGERTGDITNSKLGFVFDASGSMHGIIGTVFANAVNLLKTPAFKSSQTIVIRFSSDFSIFKVMFGHGKAAKVGSIKDKVTNWNLPTTAVFNMGEFGGTSFNADLATKIIEGLKDKWNMIFFLDSDILGAGNIENMLRVIKSAPAQVFIVFDGASTYQQFRKQTGIATPNITYFA